MKFPKDKQYTFTVIGTIDFDGDLVLDGGNYVHSSILKLGNMEPLPDPLPTTPGSVIRHTDRKVYPGFPSEVCDRTLVRVCSGPPWMDTGVGGYLYFTDEEVQGATVVFDAATINHH